jgi:hypothetical protein
VTRVSQARRLWHARQGHRAGSGGSYFGCRLRHSRPRQRCAWCPAFSLVESHPAARAGLPFGTLRTLPGRGRHPVVHLVVESFAAIAGHESAGAPERGDVPATQVRLAQPRLLGRPADVQHSPRLEGDRPHATSRPRHQVQIHAFGRRERYESHVHSRRDHPCHRRHREPGRRTARHLLADGWHVRAMPSYARTEERGWMCSW